MRTQTTEYTDLKERLERGEKYEALAKLYGKDKSTIIHHARKLGFVAHERWTEKRAVRGVCKFPECGRPLTGRGWCHAHYQIWWLTGADPTKPVGWKAPKNLACFMEGCSRPVKARGCCHTHYCLLKRNNQLPPKRKVHIPSGWIYSSERRRSRDIQCDHKTSKCDCKHEGLSYRELIERQRIRRSGIPNEIARRVLPTMTGATVKVA